MRQTFQISIVLLTLMFGRVGEAHMAWLSTGDDGKAELWFGQSPNDRAYHMPANVAAMELYTDQSSEPIKTTEVDEANFVGLRSESKLSSDAEISGHVTYGLYHGTKLTYHVEHLPGREASDWPSEARPDAPVQSVVSVTPQGGVMVTILHHGKPVEDAEVQLFSADGQARDSKTTDIGGLVTFSSDVLAAGLNAIMVGVTDTDAKGEFDGEAFGGTADYLTATFYHGDASASGDDFDGEPSDDHAAVKVLPNSRASIEPSGLPNLPEELTSFGAAIANGRLYVYGGHTGSAHSYSVDEQSNRLWALDLNGPADRQWEVLSKGPRLQGLALVSHNDRLIRLGGLTAKNATGEDHDLHSQTSVAAFDPPSGQWTDLAPLPEPRSSLDAVVSGDKLFVFGGWAMSGSDDSQWHQTAWSLDLSADDADWVAIAEPPFQRRAISAAAHDGKLYVLGGMKSEGNTTTRVDIYDIATATWTLGPPIPGSGMSGFGTSSFACQGRLYVSAMDGFVHRLTAAGDQWETIAQIDPARFFHRMLPHEGDLLLIGGANMEVGKFVEIEKVSLGK